MMRRVTKYGGLIQTIALAALLAVSCSTDAEDIAQPAPKGERAYAEVTLGNMVTAETRATKNYYDNWSVSSFGTGDVAGMYTRRGRQNPDDPDDFTLPVMNGKMFYEGRVGTAYRFGNSDIVLDPLTVCSTTNNNYSLMYYPYYENMPDPLDAEKKQGLPLRKMNNGVEKCIDFMCTSAYSYIYISNGVMSPTFKHHFVNLIFQRGQGFKEAEDQRIWVVMKNPLTDIRIKQSYYIQNNGTPWYYAYTYDVQYTPGDATEDELMVDLMGLPGERARIEPYMVNKYALWETWDGNSYNSQPSKYAIIPPSQDVYFIFIQDDYGHWQTVTDFYLSGNGLKYGSSGNRYVLTIKLEGARVVVRPVSVQKWDDEIDIADVHKVGINDYNQYRNWAVAYNAYINNGRDPYYVETLQEYGDVTRNTVTGDMSWTFYINSDIEFPDNYDDFAQIEQLDDVLEGSSTYTNYSITNLHDTMIRSMGPGGAVRALDFKDIYLVQPDDATEPFGALVMAMNGGLIEKCNILNGVLICGNEVGMIAGKVTGGEVKNCAVSGNVIGSSTADGYNGLFGTVEGNTLRTENNKVSGLQFIRN